MKAVKEAGFSLNARLSMVAMFLLISGLIILARLVTLQIIQHGPLQARASKQYKGIILLQPKRGIIYDRDMHPIAISILTESLYSNPSEIKNPDLAARLIAPIIDIKEHELASKLKAEKSFIWIKRKLSPKESERIKNLGLSGFGFITENKRFYPKRGLASQLIGFVGIDNQGLEGLEFYYEDYIKGEPEKILVERDALGHFLFNPGENPREKTKGNDLVLTIDESIQYYAEKVLLSQILKTRAKSGLAIVMDPTNGEILALADLPHFNPNSFGQYDPKQWKNSAITDSFEPGSTFKIVTAAAVLEQNKAKPDDLFFAENGSYRIHRHMIQDVHKYGWLTFKDIIVNSSNIGATKLASLLSAQEFYQYITLFGFGKQTGIDLPGESSGLVRLPKEWSALSQYSLAFGQEISVTAMQLVSAFAAIANGGILYKPQIVKEIRKHSGEVTRRFAPIQVQRVISRKTAQTLSTFLTEVVSRGTGTKAAIDGTLVAGKTGTAQKIDSRTGSYSGDKYLSSFVGFVPADNPRLTILIVIDEPSGIIYGGEVAAPVFKDIAVYSLRHLQYSPPQKVIKVDGRKYEGIKEIIAVNWPKEDTKGHEFKERIKSILRVNYERLLANFIPIRDRIISLWKSNGDITSS